MGGISRRKFLGGTIGGISVLCSARAAPAAFPAWEYSRSADPGSALIILRQGKMVASYGATFTLRNIASVSKSLTGLATAMVITQQKLSPADFAFRYLPITWDDNDARKRQIKMHHLLTMSSGLVPHDQPRSSLEYYNTVLALKTQATPGKQWAYASAPVDLLCIILRKVTGVSLGQYLDRYLWNPIGAGSVGWHVFNGYARGSSGAIATAAQLTKLGQLLLQNGVWNGRRILAEGVVDHLSTWASTLADDVPLIPPKPTDVSRHDNYTWLGKSNLLQLGWGREVPVDAFAMHGNRSNFLWIIPSLGMVITRTASQQPWGNINRQAEFRDGIMQRIMGGI